MNIEGRGVQSIEVGGRILIVLSTAGGALMLKDIAALAAIPAAQAHAYLVSFRKLGLIEQDARGLYQLGPLALQLGVARMRSHEPLRLACTAAGELAAQIGMMVTVSVWGTHGPTIVQVNEGGDQVHVNLRAGTVYSIVGTATGKVFAAFMPESLVWPYVRAEISKKKQADTTSASHPTAFRREIAKIKRLGYGTALGNPIPGVNAISSPVYDHTRQMKLAITIIGLAKNLDVGAESKDVKELLKFTGLLSAQNGYMNVE
ncbi:IclR family transcriptional regulator [Microvirga alba]|uniref:Helix-turn-helix domain-containing protein n=1 Tax=Microvirga alba TaxID=2791025 RepID=A0A931BVK0_9HYPH|nr:IclR family transcriptional regulator C-terminal domain-containing protein [Microvirga alba]MBF9235499.1 helix-turn-helix domain-containing protein [Microvirga alba]